MYGGSPPTFDAESFHQEPYDYLDFNSHSQRSAMANLQARSSLNHET